MALPLGILPALERSQRRRVAHFAHSGSADLPFSARLPILRADMQLQPNVGTRNFASDELPSTLGRTNLTEFADQVKAGVEKIGAENGASQVALVDAERLDYCHRVDREHIQLPLIDEHGL